MQAFLEFLANLREGQLIVDRLFEFGQRPVRFVVLKGTPPNL